ncbi:MAG TPA: DUF2934 domain-containing protein [Cellvibrio sp.]|nr:DUF2934 domain-containing protein [Cellvibrio sp.]
MQLNEERVRAFAHQIWESEGKPEGQASRHWEMACKLAAGEVGPADPFEPLTNIKTIAAGADPDAVASKKPAKARVKVKPVVDDPEAAPKKRASTSKTTQH